MRLLLQVRGQAAIEYFLRVARPDRTRQTFRQLIIAMIENTAVQVNSTVIVVIVVRQIEKLAHF